MTKADKAIAKIRETSIYPNDYEFSRYVTPLGQSVLSFDDGSRIIVGTGGVWTWEEFFQTKEGVRKRD